MSNHPWQYFVNKVMRSKRVNDEKTQMDQRRRYNRIHDDILYLLSQKRISTESPQKMTVNDIKELLEYRRFEYKNQRTGKLLKIEDHAKTQSVLTSLFKHPDVDNKNWDRCLLEYPELKVRIFHKILPSMTEEDYNKFLARQKEVTENHNGDFLLLRRYFVSSIGMESGSRPIEFRNIKVENVDLVNWEIFLDVVKGMETYGRQRPTVILPEARDITYEYLYELKKYKENHGIEDNPYLFPSVQKGRKDTHLAEQTLLKDKVKVEKELNIKFDFRMNRRTFYQHLLDDGITSDDGSVVMGNTVKVLEQHYGRRRTRDAINGIKQRREGKMT